MTKFKSLHRVKRDLDHRLFFFLELKNPEEDYTLSIKNPLLCRAYLTEADKISEELTDRRQELNDKKEGVDSKIDTEYFFKKKLINICNNLVTGWKNFKEIQDDGVEIISDFKPEKLLEFLYQDDQIDALRQARYGLVNFVESQGFTEFMKAEQEADAIAKK